MHEDNTNGNDNFKIYNCGEKNSTDGVKFLKDVQKYATISADQSSDNNTNAIMMSPAPIIYKKRKICVNKKINGKQQLKKEYESK